jgi:hypothetical protein
MYEGLCGLKGGYNLQLWLLRAAVEGSVPCTVTLGFCKKKVYSNPAEG